jgi:acetylglutamate kinase
MIKARKMQNADYGLVGEIEEIDPSILNSAMDGGFIPVISSVAYGIGSDAGQSLNINADTAAACIAAALSAEKLVLMTDVQGLLKDTNDPDSLIKTALRSQIDQLKQDGIVSKGMIPKIDCCAFALDKGVKRAHIIDGRLPHSLLIELFTDEGIGTMFTNQAET